MDTGGGNKIVRNPVKSTALRVLDFFGYNLKKKSSESSSESFSDIKRKEYLLELYKMYQFYVFKDLPDCDESRLKLLLNLFGTNIGGAVYILTYLNKVIALEGDICEFGVAQGATSALMANEIKTTNKNIWLFDTFAGLPKPSEKDQLKDDMFGLGAIERYQGTMSCDVGMVRNKLTEIDFAPDRAKIIAGLIEETIQTSRMPGKVCFAYVDVDFYSPALAALKFLSGALVENGIIVIDDYDWFSTGLKTAVEDFLKTNNNFRLSFPVEPAGMFCILEKMSANPI